METDNRVYTAWLDNNRNKKILYLDNTKQEDCVDICYDIIIVTEMIEYQDDPVAFLRSLSGKLNPDGVIWLYCDNRLALKYFIGEPDPFTGGYGDGLENYCFVKEGHGPEPCSHAKGMLYSVEELKAIIGSAGFKADIYSVLPDIRHPKFIISESYEPGELMSIRYFPVYRHPERVFMNEEYMMDSVIRNHMLPQMAGGLLFELSMPHGHEMVYKRRIKEVIFSDDRGRSDSMLTVIRDDGCVEKRALYSEGKEKIDRLDANLKHLKARGIDVVPGTVGDGVYEMPFVDLPLANEYLQKLFFEDRDRFIESVDAFRDCILKASEIINDDGHVQKKAFPDMVPLNAFADNGKYVFFDQEFCFEDYPADAIITRAILIIYELIASMEKELPKTFFFKRYGLDARLIEWLELAGKFTEDLITRDRSLLKNFDSVSDNRRRLNYSEREFEALTYNPVAGLEGKKVYLCGDASAIEKFTEMYQRDYEIAGVIGKDISQEDLKREESFRVIICSDNAGKYDSLRRNLEKLGIRDIAVYLKNKVYPGRQANWLYLNDEKNRTPKKYHIGYIAGVFDLYHMGHLNLLKKAKEQCDYLIVGVVTDRGVRDFKKTEPFIPFEERVELIRSCRYVDEVVEIPYLNRGTIEAFEKYHFDVQFSGSDYENNELWQYHKKWLEEHGAEMVFLPYTKETSSSKIKELIDKELI